MTITTPPAGSHRALPPGLDRNALPDNQAIQRMRAGLEQGIQGGGHGELRTAVTQFRDVFPKLSLWERFKDFFGLSDTADNRRDAAALCVIGTFYNEGTRRQTMEPEAYNRTAMTLAQILQETGLAPERGHIELEGLTADITARLLAQTRDPEGVITLAGGEMTTTPGSGDVVLSGQVSFGNAANTPELLRNLSLPFVATVISPLDMIANLMGGEEGGSTLKTLFGNLPPENRLQMRVFSCLPGGAGETLFSRDGVLDELSQLREQQASPSREQPPVPQEWWSFLDGYVRPACTNGADFVRAGQEAVQRLPNHQTINSWRELYDLTVNSALLISDEDAKKVSAVMMPDQTFVHSIGDAGVESEIQKDLNRSSLPSTDVVINGHRLSPETTCAMQDVASTADKRGRACSAEIQVKVVGEAWSRQIQNEGIEELAARKAAAAIIYSAFQGAAGNGTTGLLCKLGPVSNGLRARHSVLHINTQPEEEGTSVTRADFTTGGWITVQGLTGGADFRAGAVSYHLPPSDRTTAAEMATDFTKSNIQISGFGVYCPTSAEATAGLVLIHG